MKRPFLIEQPLMTTFRNASKIASTHTLPCIINSTVVVCLLQFATYYINRSAFHIFSFIYILSFALHILCVAQIIIIVTTLLLPRHSHIIYSFISALFLLLLYIDSKIFGLMNTHIDYSIIKLLFEPGIMDDLSLSYLDVTWTLLFFVMLFVGQLCLYKFSNRCIHYLSIPKYLRFWPLLCNSLLIAGLLFLMYSFHHYKNMPNALTYTKTIPWYLPNQAARGFSTIWCVLGVEQDYPYYKKVSKDYFTHSYEKKYFTSYVNNFTLPDSLQSKQDYNIIILCAESLRSDMLHPTTMPYLYRFGHNHCFVSENHFSTGTGTAEGLFGIFSGLSPLYWYQSKTEIVAPIFFTMLKKLGYKASVYTSSSFTYRGTDRYLFGDNIAALNEFLTARHNKNGGSKIWIQRHLENDDIEMTESYLHELENRSAGKYFDFLFFFSPHYNYYYTAEHEIFKPTISKHYRIDDFTIKEKINLVKNRYKNSVHFFDELVSKILVKLVQKGLLQKTIVVITGDHGEEFFELGSFGHYLGLNQYQSQVPFIYFQPKRSESNYTVTSHADIVPTILHTLELNYDCSKLFTGKPLFNDYDPKKNCAIITAVYITGYPIDFCLVKGVNKFAFTNKSRDVIFRKYYDLNDRELDFVPENVKLEAYNYLMEQKLFFSPFSERGVD